MRQVLYDDGVMNPKTISEFGLFFGAQVEVPPRGSDKVLNLFTFEKSPQILL